MALHIQWLQAVHGREVEFHASFLGQHFVLTKVGDVIVGCDWRLSAQNKSASELVWWEKVENGLLFSKPERLEVKLLEQGTPFTKAVWTELTQIPLGQVMSYSELAERLNSGARAVASACRKNPYPGIIPCHRVVSKSGLGGFMGQSQGPWVEFKKQLLKYERKIAEMR